MTTIIIHNNCIVADKRTRVSSMSQGHYYIDNFNKLNYTPCGRAVFCFFHEQPDSSNLTIIMNSLLMAIMEMELVGAPGLIKLQASTLSVIPKETLTIIGVKDKVYFIPKFGEVMYYGKNKDKKPDDFIDGFCFKLDKKDFTAFGTGKDYALGLWFAKDFCDITEIIKDVHIFDANTSKEFDHCNTNDLVPLLNLQISDFEEETHKQPVTQSETGAPL